MKNIRKTLRFSDEEFAKIDEQLQNLNLDFSTYARNLLLNEKLEVQVKKVKSIDERLIYHLNKIGNNLNQIARNSNQGKALILVQLVEIQKQLESIKNDS